MNYFYFSQTNLPVVILTAGILFEVIVFLRKLLRENNKIRGSNVRLFALKQAIFTKRCYFQDALYRKSEGVDELIRNNTIKTQKVWTLFNSLVPNASFLYSFLRFSDVFRGQRKSALGTNTLK